MKAFIQNKKYLIIVIGLLLILFFLTGLKNLRNRTHISQITVDNAVFDAGKVSQNSEVRHVFKLANKSKTQVNIKDIRASCNCTAATASDLEKIIEPGHSSRIEVKYNTNRELGLKKQEIYVETDSLDSPVITLTLQCFISAPLIWSPRQVDFGTITKGTQREQIITFREDPDEKSEDLKVTSDSSYIDYSLTKIQPGKIDDWNQTGGYLLNIILLPEAPVGQLNAKVSIETQNEKQPYIEIPVKVQVEGDLVPNPKSVFMGIVNEKKNRPAIFEVQRAEKSSAKVLNVTSDNSAVEAKIIEKHEDGPVAAQIEVTCKPELLEGKFNTNIKVETTSKDVPEINVAITGISSK